MDIRELEGKANLTQTEAEAVFDHHDAAYKATDQPKAQRNGDVAEYGSGIGAATEADADDAVVATRADV